MTAVRNSRFLLIYGPWTTLDVHQMVYSDSLSKLWIRLFQFPIRSMPAWKEVKWIGIRSPCIRIVQAFALFLVQKFFPQYCKKNFFFIWNSNIIYIFTFYILHFHFRFKFNSYCVVFEKTQCSKHVKKIAMINNKYPSDFTINVTRNSNMCSYKKLLRSIYYTYSTNLHHLRLFLMHCLICTTKNQDQKTSVDK